MQKVSLPKRGAEQPTLPSPVHGPRGPSVLRQPAHGLRLLKEVPLHRWRVLSVLRRPARGGRSSSRCMLPMARSIERLSVQGNAATLLLRQRHREFAQNVSNPITAKPPMLLQQLVAVALSNRANAKLHKLLRERFATALRGTAAPGLRVGSGAGYRSRRVALCGVAGQEPVLLQPRPNPSVEGTSSSKLRLLPAAPHLKR